MHFANCVKSLCFVGSVELEYAFEIGYRPLEFAQGLITTELDDTSFKSFFQLLAQKKIAAMGFPQELKKASAVQQQQYLDDINEVVAGVLCFMCLLNFSNSFCFAVS